MTISINLLYFTIKFVESSMQNSMYNSNYRSMQGSVNYNAPSVYRPTDTSMVSKLNSAKKAITIFVVSYLIFTLPFTILYLYYAYNEPYSTCMDVG